MRGVSPEIRRLVKTAQRAGWELALTGGGHVRFRSPAGALVVASQTPSDGRAWRAVRAQLRREGLDV